jgi:hypothetical protein
MDVRLFKKQMNVFYDFEINLLFFDHYVLSWVVEQVFDHLEEPFENDEIRSAEAAHSVTGTLESDKHLENVCFP